MSSAIYISRQHVVDFETDLAYKVVNAWSRTLKRGLWWPRVMLVEPSTAAASKIQEWNQETARIHHLGPSGKDVVFDPLVTASQEIVYEHFGNALKVDRSQWSDDRIDRTAKWMTETGAACLYWPQRLAALMMIDGDTTTNPITGKAWGSFDGKAFFAKDHPVGGDSSDTYSNLHNGVPFSDKNLARVVAYIETIKHGGGAPAGYAPTLIILPTNYRWKGTQVLTAEWFTDQINGATAAGQNVIKTAFDFEPPIFAPELNVDPGIWYVGVPADQDAFDGALGYWEREPFSITSYQGANNYELAKVKEFVWENYGRNSGFFGLPYRLHRCESGGSVDSYLPSDDDLGLAA